MGAVAATIAPIITQCKGLSPPGAGRAKLTPMSTELRAIQADITTLAVDAIVNAANHSLLDRPPGRAG